MLDRMWKDARWDNKDRSKGDRNMFIRGKYFTLTNVNENINVF